MKLFLFPTPADAECYIVHDKGWSVNGVVDTHPSGRVGKSITIPANTPDGNGCKLTITSPRKVLVELRAILKFGQDDLAYLLCDDFHLQDEKVCPDPEPEPEPEPDFKTPLELLEYIQQRDKYNLATVEGCGKFTETAEEALYEHFSEHFGHIRKFPPSNRYPSHDENGNETKGHAVDAVILVRDIVDGNMDIVKEGIYDIIFNSVSASAKVAFNWTDHGYDPALRYHPHPEDL